MGTALLVVKYCDLLAESYSIAGSARAVLKATKAAVGELQPFFINQQKKQQQKFKSSVYKLKCEPQQVLMSNRNIN